MRLVGAEWTRPFLDELCSFPDAKHDDQVDAAVGAYNKLAVRAALDTGGRVLAYTEEETAEGTAIGHVPTPAGDVDLLSYLREYGQGTPGDRLHRYLFDE